jgi:hypothetical protein
MASTRKALELIYGMFARAIADLDQRNSLLVQAVGIMDPICGSLRLLQQRDPNVKYLADDAEKLWNKAKLCRQRAMGTNFPEEKEVSLRMALKFMGRFAAKLNPPSIDDAILMLESNQKGGKASKAPKAPKATGQPKAPTVPGNYPSNIPPLGPDGIPAWKPGTSARICADILMAQDSISKMDARKAAHAAGFKSDNVDARINMVAGFLVKFGKLKRTKVGWVKA